MSAKSLFAIALFSLVFAAVSTPTKLRTVSRQDGFIFTTSTDGPSSVTATVPPEPEVADDTGLVPPAPAPAASEEATPVTSEVPTPIALPAVAETEPSVTMEAVPPSEGPTFAYNVGSATEAGDFKADPTDWVIGETATFEIPDAVIAGAPEDNADIYKSHRYGLVGSTWGYDIAVETPGNYDCTLHYSEIYSEFFTEEPNRTFKVEISGDASDDVQEAEFDVMVELGGAEFTPYTRTFSNIAVATTLRIRETPSIGDAFLSGISCTYMSAIEIAV